ncbi:transposase [Streptomyces sp. GC420]|uniref:RNA-guided endonuclease InsQ/TnpB family protein n=1 Tax=Streptomyces sp. GC420 TaxID=2697568 RepID=UPI0028BF0C74|nr:transposase [Streptomyces sp. GC420]
MTKSRPPEELLPTGAVVGIDVGTVHFLTTSEGEHEPNPRFLATVAEELAEAQRHLAAFPKRTRQRTRAHRAAARRVARPHARIRRKRLDFHHKTARALIADNDVVAHERLNTAGMTKSPAPRPDPGNDGAFLPNGAAAEAGLNRSILDAGWGQFLAILANKAASAGRLGTTTSSAPARPTCTSTGNRCTPSATACRTRRSATRS